MPSDELHGVGDELSAITHLVSVPNGLPVISVSSRLGSDAGSVVYHGLLAAAGH